MAGHLIAFLLLWFVLGRGLIALLCAGAAKSLECLARLQRRTGLSTTGRPAPKNLAQQIEASLPKSVKACCWSLAFAVTWVTLEALPVG